MKIFSSDIVRLIDEYTIANEPIDSIDLMERAALCAFKEIKKRITQQTKVAVFAGPGNNGGDGLAIARMLYLEGYEVATYLVADIARLSDDCRLNYERLHLIDPKHVKIIQSGDDIPDIKVELIIDALFGSGLTRALDGLNKLLVQKINASRAMVFSVDIPSGLFVDNNENNDRDAIVKSSLTISFQFPKLSFLLAENYENVGDWVVADIGLHSTIINNADTDFLLVDEHFISTIYKKRSKFSHKGTFGHALLIVGGYCKMGAAVLASKACLKSGVGLLTTHTPHIGYQILQTAVPEAMVCIDRSDILISEFPNLNGFSAVGIGPGIGTKSNTTQAVYDLITKATIPLVMDADALNILSSNPDWFKLLPEGSILTPHPGEFARMAGPFKNGFDQLIQAQVFAKKYSVILVLKGAYTVIINQQGMCYFNATGNDGMATAGSGDALTGIIAGLLSQGYLPINAAILGVWSHGLAGDVYIEANATESLTASDIIDNLGKAFSKIKLYK